VGRKLKWVKEMPPRKGGGKESEWARIVDELLQNPGSLALVYEGESPHQAERERNNLLGHINYRGVKVKTFVRGTNVYAQARRVR